MDIKEEADFMSDAEEMVVTIDPGKTDLPSTHSNSAATIQQITQDHVKIRRTLPLEPPETEFLDMFKSNASSSPPVQPYTAPPLQYNQEDKMFLLSLLPSMQDMTAVEKMDFKIKVMSLLKENLESKERKFLSNCNTVCLIQGQEQEVYEV